MTVASNYDNADSAATSAGAGATDETAVMPPSTAAPPELAWSRDDDDAPVSRGRWC